MNSAEPIAASAQSYESRLEQLEAEIRRQREVIAAIDSRLGSQDNSLASLKANVALMVASWQNEMSQRIAELSRQLGSLDQENEGWTVLRRQVESAHGDFARHIDGCSPALTEIETRVCLLVGMELTTGEIARTLNLSEQTIEKLYRELQGKLGQGGRGHLRQIFHAA
jgi:DNA-binding NarL/FixJ family response regulator